MYAGTSCIVRADYTPPPLNEAKYTGPLDNISIAQLKQRYTNITTPQLIEDNLVIKGIVTGNDESGNIYKQIFVQDASWWHLPGSRPEFYICQLPGRAGSLHSAERLVHG
jgi:hypothetical protein